MSGKGNKKPGSRLNQSVRKVSHSILRLEHTTILIPADSADLVESYYVGILNMELRPNSSAGEYNLLAGSVSIHLFETKDFIPSKAYPSITVLNLRALSTSLSEAGCRVEYEEKISETGKARFLTWDPFGNPIEFVDAM